MGVRRGRKQRASASFSRSGQGYACTTNEGASRCLTALEQVKQRLIAMASTGTSTRPVELDGTRWSARWLPSGLRTTLDGAWLAVFQGVSSRCCRRRARLRIRLGTKLPDTTNLGPVCDLNLTSKWRSGVGWGESCPMLVFGYLASGLYCDWRLPIPSCGEQGMTPIDVLMLSGHVLFLRWTTHVVNTHR